jgi:Zn-dependent protease
MLTTLFSDPFLFLVWVVAFLVALTVHEFSHALVGTWLGDSTAERLGRLTLNPAAHVDPFGLLAVLLIGFGWGKPVPFNPYNLKWQKWGPTLISAAGPVSNLLMGTLAAVLLHFFGASLGSSNLLTAFLIISLELNIALMVFNLIPLPPLDGSKALISLLSSPKYIAARTFIETKGPMLLIGLILIDSFTNLGLFSGLFSLALSILNKIIPLPPIL